MPCKSIFTFRYVDTRKNINKYNKYSNFNVFLPQFDCRFVFRHYCDSQSFVFCSVLCYATISPCYIAKKDANYLLYVWYIWLKYIDLSTAPYLIICLMSYTLLAICPTSLYPRSTLTTCIRLTEIQWSYYQTKLKEIGWVVCQQPQLFLQ